MKGTSKNSNFFVRARKHRAQNRSVYEIHEDSSTGLTPLSRTCASEGEKCIFRSALNTLSRIYLGLMVFLVSACGPTGDTEGLKQNIEKNRLNITSVIIKPQYTLTLDPVSVSPANPKYYFEHNDAEQLQAYGITDSSDEILLSNVSWSITDSSNTAGSTTINSDGLLSTESLTANLSKDIAVNIGFAGLTATADVVISSYPLSTGGLSLKINDAVVNNTSPSIPVCSTSTLKAEGLFDDGSTRNITSKITWSAALANSDAKFVTSDPNAPVFSAHTNATYVVTPSYKGQGTATMSFEVSDTGFSSFVIDSSTVSIASGETHTLKITADIDSGSGKVNNDVTSRAKWSSADKAIFTVDDPGVIAGVATGGPINVTAQCGTTTVTSSVTVNIDNTIKSIEILDKDSISIAKIDLIINDTINLQLRVNKMDGSTENVTSHADTSWVIDTLTGQGEPITIDNSTNKGLVTAKAVGIANVIAKYKGREDSLTVNVAAN